MARGMVQGLYHSDYRTVSHCWVLLVYVALIRAVWADYSMGTCHYYFDEIVKNYLIFYAHVSESVVAQSAQRGTFFAANGAEDARRVKLVRAQL
jgi:hypothetical protein